MRFSIVITATRPRLLEFSLRSALAQDFGDYEIVVSDNSVTDGNEFIRSVGKDRVRCVRPDRRMAMVEHWDFAFSHARGEWHVLLCDDDAITPNLLTTLDRQISAHPEAQLFCWNYGVYRDDDHWRARSQIGVNKFTGHVTRYQSNDLLRQMFESGTGLYQIKHKIPFFPRAVCHGAVLDAIRERQGRLFHPYCPMTSGAAAMLAFSDQVIHLDLPLTLFGETLDSCGAWIADPSTMDATHGALEVELAPIKTFRILPTALAESLLRTQRAMPDKLGGYHLDYVNYFLHCDLFLRGAQTRGFDTIAYRRIFNQALAGMSPEIQASVQARLSVEPTSEPPSAYLRAKRVVGRAFERLREPRLPGEVDAARLGLRSISDGAAYVGAMIDRLH